MSVPPKHREAVHSARVKDDWESKVKLLLGELI